MGTSTGVTVRRFKVKQKCSMGGVWKFSRAMHFAAMVMYPCDQFWQEQSGAVTYIFTLF